MYDAGDKMRRSIATPCPVSASQREILDETFADDTTTKLEYTTAFHASFRNVRPRRVQLARQSAANFVIHEDAPVAAGSGVGQPRSNPSRLLQPAKRVIAQRRVQDGRDGVVSSNSNATSPKQAHNVKSRGPPLAAKQPPIAILPPAETIQGDRVNEEQMKVAIERPARRKTLYIPSDDTTQPTMWMGIFSPIKNELDFNDDQHGQAPIELTGIAARMAEQRHRRTSNMQVKARRVPFQHNPTAQPQSGDVPDRPGAPTGKENLPPGHSKHTRQSSTSTAYDLKPKQGIDRDAQRKKFLAKARSEKLSRSTQSGPGSPEIKNMYEIGKVAKISEAEKPKKAAWNAGPRAVTRDRPVVKREHRKEQSLPESHKAERPLPAEVPTRFVQPSLYTLPRCSLRMPIAEHIEHPEMYEEDWLGQQEIVITQLLNSVLSQARSSSERPVSRDKTRSKLLDRYSNSDIRLVYNRIQAACLYGSLSLSHEAIFQLQGLTSDIGRRKDFLKFWVDNYESEHLWTALEVVSGRQIDIPPRRKSSDLNPLDSTKRQNLTGFIESFVLRHEDSQFKAAGSGVAGDLGHKTILKSLMLVKALDLLKEEGNQLVGNCLFRKQACIKSSKGAVQAMMQMLNPAVGDSIRALRQLGYAISHQQEPWDELSCSIENLAVDLRDGICLTRLVEILLYRPTWTRNAGEVNFESDTVTVIEGQTISLSTQESHPLTQHLKIPCVSRAAKIWNVQVALGALRNVKNIERLIEGINADDIVDGYREKTIKLLWTIMGRWGLASFIDKDDLKQEVRRLSQQAVMRDNVATGNLMDDLNHCESLVKAWAKAVAASRGLQVRNLTTSFSDGRVFEAILDEYEPYLARGAAKRAVPLHERLIRLGCSKQFAGLFDNNDGQVHIFGKDFVLAALAFLCSRVVGPSKLCRSAIQIQRCWRRYWHQVQQNRAAVKRHVAEACAASACLRFSHAHDHTSPKPVDLGTIRKAATEEHARSEMDEDIWLSL